VDPDILKVQMIEDAREALHKYGGTLDIRRDSLQPLLRKGSEVPIQRVRLIYEGGDLKPKDVNALTRAVQNTKSEVPGVEVLFQ
jgi:CBS-domain-containing membrane protein